MSVYKNEKTGKWDAIFRITDWQGNSKQIHKRGFLTKREAQAYENSYQIKNDGSTDMTFSEYAEVYLKDIKPRIKASTYDTKSNIINKRIVPFFVNKKLIDISANDIMHWQNELISGGRFRSSYLKTIHNQMSAMLNFAVKYYGLPKNAAAVVGNMGNEKEIKMQFWTYDEYKRFSNTMKTIDGEAYYAFEVLYWTGIREGELLALTRNDFDFENKTLSISKTYRRTHMRDEITSPKTPKSNRKLLMPNHLVNEMIDYCSMLYKMAPDERIFFTMNKHKLATLMRICCAQCGVKVIKIHELRHSHVSLLIDMGYTAVAIAARMGHESADITYRYAHMFPNAESEMIERLEKLNNKET